MLFFMILCAYCVLSEFYLCMFVHDDTCGLHVAYTRYTTVSFSLLSKFFSSSDEIHICGPWVTEVMLLHVDYLSDRSRACYILSMSGRSARFCMFTTWVTEAVCVLSKCQLPISSYLRDISSFYLDLYWYTSMLLCSNIYPGISCMGMTLYR